MSLRILQVIDRLDIGGAEKIAVMISKILSQEDILSDILTIVVPGVLSESLHSNVNCINLSRKSKWSIFSARSFMKIISSYDLIHVHLRHNLNWVIFWSIILRKKLNIVFHDHNNTILKWNILYQIQNNNISQIVVNKKIYNDTIQSNTFFKQTHFLENIVLPVSTLGEYIKNPKAIHLVTISNLRSLKNIEFAFKLVSYLNRKRKVTLDLYYTHFDEEYFVKLHNFINKFKIQDRVKLIKGEIEPQRFFNKYDLAIHPSIRESGPLTLLEYIAQGLPFVAFDTGQSIKLINNDFPEFIAHTFSEDEWIKNIELILKKGRLYYNKMLQDISCHYNSSENYYKNCKEIYLKNLA